MTGGAMVDDAEAGTDQERQGHEYLSRGFGGLFPPHGG
jgi:hypothetical protein